MTADGTAPATVVGPRGTQEVVLGLLSTAGMDLALPLSALREVVPCPEELGAIPVAAVGLLGVMTLRSTIVPVVDLAHVLGLEHARDRGQVVVVVAHQGQVLGLLVDRIRGMAAVPTSAVVEMGCQGGELIFSGSFHDLTQGHVVSLIDPDAVLSLPGVPVVRESPDRSDLGAASVSVAASASRRVTRSLTLVRCGPFNLAIDVAFLHSTVPAPDLRSSPADGPLCLGVTAVAGFDVAVADVLTLLGLGTLKDTVLECGLVLDLPAGQVVLGVGSMIGLHDVPEDLIVALPSVASSAPTLLTRVADVPGVGVCLLIDGTELLATRDVVSLSRIATASDLGAGQDAGSQRALAAGPLHLSYTAGVGLATELGQVVEVLAYPKELVRSTGAPGVLGFVVHRGVAVPVVCLSEVLSRDPDAYTAASRLLLIEVDGESVAYAVASLHAILKLAWVDVSAVRPETSTVLGSCPLVQLDTMDALLPVLDLHALTRRLRRPAVADAVPEQRQPASAPQPAGTR